MLIERGLKKDVQVSETAKMLKEGKEFDKILARDGTAVENKMTASQIAGPGYTTTSTVKPAPTLQSRW